jgi:hypothetical protein
MRFRWNRRPLQFELTISDAVTVRAGAMVTSRWPPFVYPEIGVSIRWGRSQGARVWRHYGINLSDLGTLALSIHQHRLHVSVIVVHLGVDLPWGARDRTFARLSLFEAVSRRRRPR